MSSSAIFGVPAECPIIEATPLRPAVAKADGYIASNPRPRGSATASTIAARDASGDLFANAFHGSGASLTNIPSSALPATIVYNNQANIYTAGSKQTFKASSTSWT